MYFRKIRPQRHHIRLTVKRTDLPDIVEETQVAVDPTLHPDWPQRIPAVTGSIGTVTVSLAFLENLTAGDLDADGQAEITVGYGAREIVASGFDREAMDIVLHVINSDGKLRQGWPAKAGGVSVPWARRLRE
jgi:hypothetical protein